MKNLLIIVVFILSSLAFVGKAGASNHSGQWEVYWQATPCPKGALCKLNYVIEPNYGQALKVQRILEAAGINAKLAQLN